MSNHHYLVQSALIDQLALEFLAARRDAEAEYAANGASALFLILGNNAGEKYTELCKALDLKKDVVFSADGQKARIVRVERFARKTIITLPMGTLPDDLGPEGPFGSATQSIDFKTYDSLRQNALSAMGMLAPTMLPVILKLDDSQPTPPLKGGA